MWTFWPRPSVRKVPAGDVLHEDSRALRRKRLPLDPVEQKGGRVGCEAGHDHRGRRAAGPAEELGEGSPVGLGPEVVGERLGAGDDQAVGPCAVYELDGAGVARRASRAPRRLRSSPGSEYRLRRTVVPPSSVAAAFSKSTNCCSVASKAELGMLLTRAISIFAPSPLRPRPARASSVCTVRTESPAGAMTNEI